MSGRTSLQGRHALVTGASSGLGADLARELDWERERAMLELDIIVPVHLTKPFLPGMLDRRLLPRRVSATLAQRLMT